MKLAAKIIRRQLQHGYLYSFSIVRNLRRNGTPTNVRIAGLGSIRQSEILDSAARLEFWARVNSTINKLKAEKVMSDADAETIKAKCAAIVPPTSKKVDLSRYSILVAA